MRIGSILHAHRSVARLSFSFLLISLSVLALILGAVMVLWSFPYDGLYWSAQSGHVAGVDPYGPAAEAGIRAGDRVLALDGIPLADVFPLYGSKQVGDSVTVTLLRAGQRRTVSLTLAVPPPRIRFGNLEPLLVGLIFWLVGVGACLLRPSQDISRLFFLLGQVTGAMLAAGDLSALRMSWAIRLFGLLLLFLAPLALHFYASFPDLLASRWRRPLLGLAYGGAGFLAVGYLLQTWPPKSPLGPDSLWAARRLFVALVLLVALALLLRPRRTVSLQTRRRQRLLIAGMLLSPGPLLFLSFLPELLHGFPLVDYTWTFPFLTLLPLSYASAVYQRELSRVDRILNRSLVYFLLTTLLLSVYGLLFLGLDRLLPAMLWSRPLVGAALVMGMAALFGPLRAWVQRLVDHLFYGGWYDYRTVVREGSQNLNRSLNLDQLSVRLMDVVRTMRFRAAALLWPVGTDLVPWSSFGYGEEALARFRLPLDGAVARYLAEGARPRRGGQVSRDLAVGMLTEEEKALLAAGHVCLWLPLVSRGRLRGVLAVGARQAGEGVEPEDVDILATVGEQAAVVAENVVLLESLRARLAEVEQARDELTEARRRLAESREAERQRLARELHDRPVQDLYGLLFRLEEVVEDPAGEESLAQLAMAREELLQVIDELRNICQELRPPTLATFGLAAAIRSHAGRFQEMHPGLEIQMDLVNDGQTLPERVRLALYHIYREVINNVARHAEAQRVRIRFSLNEKHLLLEIEDDGAGFQVPVRWIQLARQGHLGLLGAAEWADSIGGRLEIESAPGQGTVVRVTAERGAGSREWGASSVERQNA